MPKWEEHEIDNWNIEGLCNTLHHYTRKMGDGPEAVEVYNANVFICEFKNIEQMLNNWEKINYLIAFKIQSKISKDIEKSNFYLCLFVENRLDEEQKSKIQSDSFCAKKYVFDNVAGKDYVNIIERKIFKMEMLNDSTKSYKMKQIELVNFRRYEGTFKIDLLGKLNKPAAFILIYAKNGYGKTSIFDGLEYLLKGEVHRIINLINNSKQQPLTGAIYHNKNRADKTAYAKVVLEDNEVLQRNVVTLKEGKNDCKANKVGEKFGRDIIGGAEEKEKWNQIILPHDKIDNFIMANKPSDRYLEWANSAPELKKENSSFIRLHSDLRDKQKSIAEIQENVQNLKKRLNELEVSKKSVEKLSGLCEKYNKLVEPEETFFFNNNNSVESYYELLDDISQKIRFIKEFKIALYKDKIIKAEEIKNSEINDESILNEKFENENHKKKSYLDDIQNKKKYDEAMEKSQVIESEIIKIKKEKDTIDKIYKIGINNVIESKKKYNQLIEEIDSLKKTIEYFKIELDSVDRKITETVKNIAETKKYVTSSEKQQEIEEIIDRIEHYKSDISKGNEELFKKQILKEQIESSLQENNRLYENIIDMEIPKKLGDLSAVTSVDKELILSESDIICLNNYEAEWKKLKNELDVNEAIVKQNNEINLEIENLRERGKSFLLNHRNEKNCPLCNTSFQSWEMLFEQVQRIELLGEKEIQAKQEIICKMKNLDMEYEKFYTIWRTKKGNKLKELDDIILHYKNQLNAIEESLAESQKKQDDLRSKIVFCEQTLKNKNVILSEYSKELWNELLKMEKNKYNMLLQDKKEMEGKILHLKNLYLANNRTIEKNKRLVEQIINNSEVYSSILYLSGKDKDFNIDSEKNILSEKLKVKENEEKSNNLIIKQYEMYALKDIENLKNGISGCDEKIARLKELQKKASIFSEFSPNGVEKDLNEWRKKIENYQERLELLYQMNEENSARVYFKEYSEVKSKISENESRISKMEQERQSLDEIYSKQKSSFENKLKEYFNQTTMNEIYQKIDPHDIMKNVTYNLNFNEKDEPQLFIEVQEENGNGGVAYRPENYFSTAQLNTVAFSSFFGRALSASNLPVRTICIDDPIGHFDDMNILGFTDMIRDILETQHCQIIMSTHDEKVYQIMKRKLDENYYNTAFIDLESDERAKWVKA